jgi:hypothetical protein
MSSALLRPFAGLLVLSRGVGSSDAATRHPCKNLRYVPMHRTITEISVENSGCATAHRVALAYERAITSSYSVSTGATRNGVCFPRQSFGQCTITVLGRRYLCNRPEGSGYTLPAICTRKFVRVRFRG